MIYRDEKGHFCTKAYYKIYVEQKGIPYMERDFSVLKGYEVEYNRTKCDGGDKIKVFVANINPSIGISLVNIKNESREECCIRKCDSNYEVAFKVLVRKIQRGKLNYGLITAVVERNKLYYHNPGTIYGSVVCGFK